MSLQIIKSPVDYGKVSIIIPTYNRGQYLEEAIESALSQTYQNCEVIVCDDGSTDNTLFLLEKYRDKITLVKHKNNKGVSAALNSCINMSNGKYLSWLSSDDIYVKNKIEMEVEYLSTHTRVDMVYSDFYYLDKYSQIIERAHVTPLSKGNEIAELFQRNPINGCSVLFYKKCINKVGLFDENIGGKYGYGADTCMWHKIAYYFNIDFINEPLVYYRIHGDNVSDKIDTRNGWKEYREYMKLWFERL